MSRAAEIDASSPPVEGFVLVPREYAARLLKSIERVTKAAHSRGRQVCCGYPQGIECCMCPDVEWDDDDEEIMAELGPLEDRLAAMLAAAPQKAEGGREASWSEVEDALDKAGAPLRLEDGRWLTFPERIAALATPQARTGGGLPARDSTKTNTEQGIYRKFDVQRADGSDAPGGKHDGCEYFVLDMTHDALALPAVAAYANAAEATHPLLAADLRQRYGLTAPEAAP